MESHYTSVCSDFPKCRHFVGVFSGYCSEFQRKTHAHTHTHTERRKREGEREVVF